MVLKTIFCETFILTINFWDFSTKLFVHKPNCVDLNYFIHDTYTLMMVHTKMLMMEKNIVEIIVSKNKPTFIAC